MSAGSVYQWSFIDVSQGKPWGLSEAATPLPEYSMRFSQLDRITELEAGKRITAIRQLHADEDYLRDHFPLFPVMPGVLMLEAMFQACAWLVRVSDDFRPTVVDLVEARNVKYADFMQPGDILTVTAEVLKSDGDTITLKAQGTKADAVAVSARLVLRKSTLRSADGSRDAFDDRIQEMWQKTFTRLFSDSTVVVT